VSEPAEIPAALVAIFVTSASLPMIVAVGSNSEVGDGLGWIQILLMGAFPIWGLALGAATVAYHLRRGGTCDTCHRGWTTPAIRVRGTLRRTYWYRVPLSRTGGARSAPAGSCPTRAGRGRAGPAG